MASLYRVDDGDRVRSYVLAFGRERHGRFEAHGYRVILRDGPAERAIDFDPDGVEVWAAHQPAPVRERLDATLARIHAPFPPLGALSTANVRIMGVVNVTPDSFSDGGRYLEPAAAIAHGRALVAAGADMLDIGGESTRPGAAPVAVRDEMDRVLPVITGLADSGVPLSVDTRHAPVMQAALAAGASVVNDVTALTGDGESLAVCAASEAAVVLMHMRGEPGTMQDAPQYTDILLDVYDYLEERVAACVAAGIPRSRIAIDPGIGFGKTDEHNLQLISGLSLFLGLGCAIVLGVSRKSLIGRVGGVADPGERLPGSLALGLAGADRGARILRVHDVAETRQALALWQAVDEALSVGPHP